MRAASQTIRKHKPWAGLSAILPVMKPATKKDIQVLRKLWHVGMMAFVAALYLFVFPTREFTLGIIVVLGGPVVALDFLRLRWKWLNRRITFLFGPLMRKQELLSVSAMTHFLIALFILVALFPKLVVVLSILCLAFGDPAACIMGIKFGKDLITKKKSLQGSLACFAVCTVLSFIGLTLYGVTADYVLFISVVAGTAATMAELFATKRWDDNFTIPLATASTMYPLLLLFSEF